MTQVSERLSWLLSLDSDGAIRSFQKVGAEADKNLGKVDAKLDKMGAKFTKFGAGAIASSVIVGAGLSKLGSAYGDLNETVSKTGVVFGTASGQVMSFADSAAQAAGMSKRAALDAASGFGTLFTNIGKTDADAATMSISMTKLAADMASFSNTTPEDAVLALGAALRGEAEPIRKYGVLLDDATLKQRAMTLGIFDGVGSLTTAERAQAAYAEILAQTSKQQGDFARTSDGLANQQRIARAEWENLKTTLGSGVYPAQRQIVSGITSIFEGLNSLDPAIVQGAGTFATYGAAGLATVGVMSSVAGQAIKMRNTFTTTNEVAGVMVTSLNKAGKAAAAAGIAFGALAVIMAVKQLAGETEKFSVEVEKLARGTGEDLVRAFDGAGRASKVLGDMQKELLDTMTQDLGVLQRFIDELNRQGRDTTEYTAILNKRIEEEKRANEAQKTSTELTKESTTATVDQKEAQKDLTEKLKAQREAYEDLQDELDDYSGRLDALTKTTFTAAETDAAWNGALVEMRETLAKNGPVLDTWTAKGRENRAAVQDVTESAAAMVQVIAQEYPTSVTEFRKSSDVYIGELQKQLKEAGLNNTQISTFLGYLKTLQEQEAITIQARVKFTADTASLSAHGMFAIPELADALIAAGIPSGAVGTRVPGLPGQKSIVVAHGGERVASQNEVQSAGVESGAGGGITINGDINLMGPPEQAARDLMAELRRLQRAQS